MQNYYHLLGVSNFASFEEIAAAYKQKHNELFSSDSPLANIPKLRALKEGFEVLVDEEKREEYDEKLNAYLEDIDVKFEEAIKDISSRDLQSAIEKINWCIARNPGRKLIIMSLWGLLIVWRCFRERRQRLLARA